MEGELGWRRSWVEGELGGGGVGDFWVVEGGNKRLFGFSNKNLLSFVRS